MADRLARIFGTEEDKVNCPFYYKIGACRHGDRCTRLHNKPLLSQTIILQHLYKNPPVSLAIAEGTRVPDEALKEAIRHCEDFYEEIFLELVKFGEIEEVHICDNIGDHLIGNVYVKFSSEEMAEKAFKGLGGRYYAGQPILVEFSPVADFREARCRQYDEGICGRGGYCNFMHLKKISESFKRSLTRQMYEEYPEYKKRTPTYKSSRKRSRSREHKRRRSREGRHDRSRSRSREKHNYRHKDRYRNKPRDNDINPRQTSEERRAMIAKWNEETENQ